jgi:hypothetical protein
MAPETLANHLRVGAVIEEGALLRAEEGAQFIASLQRTDHGPRASYLVMLEPEERENARPQRESAEELFGTEAEALRWLDEQATRRGFNRYPMVRDDGRRQGSSGQT